MFRGGGELWLAAGFCAGVWQRLVGVAHMRGCPPLLRIRVVYSITTSDGFANGKTVARDSFFHHIRRLKCKNGRPEVRKILFL